MQMPASKVGCHRARAQSSGCVGPNLCGRGLGDVRANDTPPRETSQLEMRVLRVRSERGWHRVTTTTGRCHSTRQRMNSKEEKAYAAGCAHEHQLRHDD